MLATVSGFLFIVLVIVFDILNPKFSYILPGLGLFFLF